MRGIYSYNVQLDPIYRTLTIQLYEPLKKDITIEWGLEESAIVRVEEKDDALRIIIEGVEEA